MPKTPTPKQIMTAKAVIENLKKENPKGLGEILENIGYSPSIALNPQMVTESVGFKQALRDLGLTEELITNSLVEDIKLKPQNRVQEIKLGAEILGMKIDDKVPEKNNGNTYNIFFNKEIQEDVQRLENVIKNKLTQKHVPESI